MFNLVEKRRWYFLLSSLIIVPGIVIMIYSWMTIGAPFRLSIDFVGGSIYDLVFESAEQGTVTEDALRAVFSEFDDDNVVIQRIGRDQLRWRVPVTDRDALDVDTTIASMQNALSGSDLTVVFDDLRDVFLITAPSGSDVSTDTVSAGVNQILADAAIEPVHVTGWSVRGGFHPEETIQQIADRLNEIATLDRSSFRLETVSATVGQEVTRTAIYAVIAAAIVITTFIVIAFRQVPNAFRYGVCAIFAMIHDILVVMGVMSLLGLLLGWEVDALFLTAVLTVVGFSVQDSIVVFDRIRENIPLRLGEPFETIVNRSLWETIHRSLATQLNAFFIMVAILSFGGNTIQQFILILFVGLLTGSYSSLFTAVPMLVAWEKGEIPFLRGDHAVQEA
jgi:preprotein translocase SecF subunit